MTTTVPRATMPVPLRFRLSFPSPGTIRLAAAGEVDLATAPTLGKRLLTVVDAHRPAVIDIDLAKVSFLDCSGVSVLVRVRNTVEPTGCQIRISHPQPIVAMVLDLLGLLGPLTAPIMPCEPPPAALSLPDPQTGVAGIVSAGRIAA
jgi:anti-anti-sigma factor